MVKNLYHIEVGKVFNEISIVDIETNNTSRLKDSIY